MKPKKNIKPQQKQNKQPALPVFKPNIWLAVISAVVGFCLYVNTVKHDYVLDDVGAITGNEFVMQGIRGIPKILNVGMWHFDNVNLGYYRPLSMITFAIENQFFPNNPHVSHLGNVILYALTGFFLCLLLMNLFKNFHPIFSFIVTLLFLAHPIHTEVVANIKSRDEIFAFLNLIIATFILLKSTSPLNSPLPKERGRRRGLLLLSCLFFYLALLSKESAMTGLLIAPLVLFFSYNISIKQALLKTIPFALMIFIFQIHKFEVLGSLAGQIPKDIVNYPYAEAGTKLPTTFLIFIQCIKMILLPHPLSYDYSYNQIPAGTFGSPLVLLGFIIAAALAYFSIKGLQKKSPLNLGALIFGITLAPALAFVFLRGGIFAERFLYAPSLGFCIAIVFLAPLLSPRRGEDKSIQHYWMQKFAQLPSLREGLEMGIFSLIFSLYSFKTITRNPVWHDNMMLFSTDVNSSPNSCQVRRHYGSELINSGIAEKDPQKKTEWFNKGAEQLREALRINPRFGDAYFKLGVAYQTVNINNDSAIYYYTRAIQEAPGYAISYNNLGILYESTGKQELASYYYNKAVEVNPFFPDGKHNSEAHKKKTGLDVRLFPTSNNLDSLENSTPLKNRDFQFYYKLGTDYASKGDYTNAARCLEKSSDLNPTYVDALVNLANCYGMLKNYSKNIEVLNKVLALNPTNVQALSNLAVTYELMGNKDKSEEYRDKARELTGR
ncbi:MAG: tetratricopeptide repeat protein [Bacteroidetes bacterium]|nr:tetratricopeptide repeat protein [Bacteroidota bacterium]